MCTMYLFPCPYDDNSYYSTCKNYVQNPIFRHSEKSKLYMVRTISTN